MDKVRYYWCVNCGNHGDYGKKRQRGITCQECDYDEITPLDQQEWDEHWKQVKENKERFKDL